MVKQDNLLFNELSINTYANSFLVCEHRHHKPTVKGYLWQPHGYTDSYTNPLRENSSVLEG